MKIGDRVHKIPAIEAATDYSIYNPRIRHSYPATVVYINREHAYYMVEFDNGIRECFKLHGGTTV